MSLSVAGDRKTVYISRICPFYRIGDVAECRWLSARLSSRLSLKLMATIQGTFWAELALHINLNTMLPFCATRLSAQKGPYVSFTRKAVLHKKSKHNKGGGKTVSTRKLFV